MDIIDKLFKKLDKDQAPAQLRARILDIPEAQGANAKQNLSIGSGMVLGFSTLFFRFSKAAVPLVLLLAILAGVWYAYFRTPNYAAAFELSAEQSDAAGVLPQSSFILKTSHGLSVYQIKKIVTFNPKSDFSVEDLGHNSYKLTPSAPLVADKIYTVQIKQGPADHDYSWAYQIKAPFQVIGTTPGKFSVGAPANTGIEISFNRQKFVAPENYFQISPAVDGKFEQYGTVLIFQPKQPLQKQAVYTVTIKKGMGISGSSDTLAQDYTYTFETAADPTSSSGGYVYFPEDFTQSADHTPTFNVSASSQQLNIAAAVYKFANADLYANSYSTSRDWSKSWSSYNGVPKDYTPADAQKISEFTPQIQFDPYTSNGHMTLPQAMDDGYYLLKISYGPKGYLQDYLWFQVTPFAHYISSSESKSLIWLYDFQKRQPIEGAQVSAGNAALANTDASGLAQFATPQSFNQNLQQGSYYYANSAPNILRIHKAGYSDYVALANIVTPYSYYSSRQKSKYWQALTVDRPIYKITDTVNYWGIAKARDNTSVTGQQVTIGLYKNVYLYANQLRGSGAMSDAEPKPLVSTITTVTDYGTYQGAIKYAGLDAGDYQLIAKIGDTFLNQTSFQVLQYSKPIYQLKLDSERERYFAGEQINYTAALTFYDGTPLANTPVVYSGYWNSQKLSGTVTTDAQGIAKFSLSIPYAPSTFWPQQFLMTVQPASGEEAFVTAQNYVSIFGPKIDLTSSQKTNADASNTFSAEIRNIDISQHKTQGAGSTYDYGYYSSYIAGVAAHYPVTAVITKSVWIKRQTGTYYDYISKTVEPQYAYDRSDTIVETINGATGDDGKFIVTRSYPYAQDSWYSIKFSAADADGKIVNSTNYYSYPPSPGYQSYYSGFINVAQVPKDLMPNLQLDVPKPSDTAYGYSSYAVYHVGEAVKMHVAMNPAANTSGVKVLLYQYQQDILKATVLDSLAYQDTFDASFKPTVNYRAVVLGPAGFEESNSATAAFQTDDANLKIKFTPDKASYKPGQTADIALQVTDASGNPAAVEVNVSVVDQSLFDLTQQQNFNLGLLNMLYRPVIIEPIINYTRYNLSSNGDGRGGGGGGDAILRSKFLDSALFQSVHTDASGNAHAIFTMPDNLTSWRITAQAYDDKNIRAGADFTNIINTLPFFVDATMSDTYLAADKPQIRLRAFGSEYHAGQNTVFTATNPELGLNFSKTSTDNVVYVDLPQMKTGTYQIRFSAEQAGRKDQISRPITIVDSYFMKPQNNAYTLSDKLQNIAGSQDGMTHLLFTDAGRGRYVFALQAFSYAYSLRLDARVAAFYAAKTLHDSYGMQTAPDAIDLSTYQKGNGLGLLSYADADLKASAMTASLIPEYVPGPSLTGYFNMSLTDQKADIHRVVLALYGLSGLNQPVLTQLQLIKDDPNLTLEDKLYVASALANLGDREDARKIFVEQIQPQLKYQADQAWIADEDPTRQVKLTAMAGVVAAQSEMRADQEKIWQFTETHYPVKDTDYLEKSLMVKAALATAQPVDGSFTYSTNQGTSKIDLSGGKTLSVDMLASELQSLHFSNVKGDVRLAVLYDKPENPANLSTTNSAINISRSYTVNGVQASGTLKEGDIVKVNLTLHTPQNLTTNTYQVIDVLPSGMRPITPTYVYDPSIYYQYDPCNRDLWYPDQITNNRIAFTIYNDTNSCKGSYVIKYTARVVSPGVYKADPAQLAPVNDTNNAALSSVQQITILPYK